MNNEAINPFKVNDTFRISHGSDMFEQSKIFLRKECQQFSRFKNNNTNYSSVKVIFDDVVSSLPMEEIDQRKNFHSFTQPQSLFSPTQLEETFQQEIKEM